MQSEDLYHIIGANLTRILSERGESVKSMAEKMGVSAVAASSWCRGLSAPRLSRIPELCDWLGCDVEDLLVAFEPGDDGMMRVRASWEEIAIIMAYRQAGEERKQVVREILRVTDTGGVSYGKTQEK